MKHNAVCSVRELYTTLSVSAADKLHTLSESRHTLQSPIGAFQNSYARCDKQDVQGNIRHQGDKFVLVFGLASELVFTS